MLAERTPHHDSSVYENTARSDSFEPLSIDTDPKKKKSQQPATPLLATGTPDGFTQQAGANEFEVIEEVHDLVINRQPGQGLGVSIAGGKGSPPYKGSDEVCIIYSPHYGY